MSKPAWMVEEEEAHNAKRERIAKKVRASMPQRQADKLASLARLDAEEQVRDDAEREQAYEDHMVDTGRFY